MNDLGWTDDVASGGQAGNFPPHQTPLFSPLHMHAAAHPLNNQRARYCMPAVPRPASLPHVWQRRGELQGKCSRAGER